MPLTAYIIPFDDPGDIEEECLPDDDGLDEFLDHPTCGLNPKDGTCKWAHTRYCDCVCRNGNKGGAG